MTNVQKALEYLTMNPTLSFHHVAVKFGIEAKELQKEYQYSRVKDTRDEN